jgi:uncharacterized protein YecT (DUF1311 family)
VLAGAVAVAATCTKAQGDSSCQDGGNVPLSVGIGVGTALVVSAVFAAIEYSTAPVVTRNILDPVAVKANYEQQTAWNKNKADVDTYNGSIDDRLRGANSAFEADHAPPMDTPERAASKISPSFNCLFAKQADEREVCRDPNLASKDARLAVMFKECVTHCANPGQVTKDQRAWLEDRARCSVDKRGLNKCLEEHYSARISALEIEIQSIGQLADPVIW